MRSLHRIATCLTLLLTAVTHQSASAQDLTGLIGDALPNVVTLVAYTGSGSAMGQGSGFVLEDGRIATNVHVVAGAAWVEVLNSEGQSAGTVPFAEALSSRADLAILPAVSGLGDGLAIAAAPPEIGSRVAVIGSPQGLESTVSDGLVSGRREVDGISVIQISAPISPGSSGGPVVNFRGEVTGIAVSQLTTGQNLNFAVPASELLALMGSPASRLALAELSAPRHTGISTREVDEFLAALRDLPRLETDTSITGSLSPDDFELEGRYQDWYRIDVTGGEDMSLMMVSEDLDTHLGIFSEDRLRAFATNDSDSLSLYDWSNDDYSGTNSAIDFTPLRDGVLYVVASSYGTGEKGPYEIGLFAGRLEDLLAADDSTPARRHAVDDRWVHSFAFDVDAVLVDVYWDRASVVNLSGDRYEVWFMWLYESPSTTSDGDEVDEIRALWEVNCGRRQMRQLEWYRYLYGESVSSQESADELTKPIPGSVGEGMLDAFCSG